MPIEITPTQLSLLVIVVVTAVVFDFINGLHDTANAVATAVGTGVLPYRAAVYIAGIFNFLGAILAGTAVAKTIGGDIISNDAKQTIVVFHTLIGAIAWGLITWYYGIPSSSSHALIGGLIGSAVFHSGWTVVNWVAFGRIALFLVVSPIIGMAFSFIGMLIVIRIVQKMNQTKVQRTFRYMQMLSTCFMATSHGSNDAQKTMGIITMALFAAKVQPNLNVPTWVIVVSALAMGLGTAMGGARIIHTMGTKLVELKPPQGCVAETGAAITISICTQAGLPVSTTHLICGALLGVALTKRLSLIGWGVIMRMFTAWFITIPASGSVAALSWVVVGPLIGPK